MNILISFFFFFFFFHLDLYNDKEAKLHLKRIKQFVEGGLYFDEFSENSGVSAYTKVMKNIDEPSFFSFLFFSFLDFILRFHFHFYFLLQLTFSFFLKKKKDLPIEDLLKGSGILEESGLKNLYPENLFEPQPRCLQSLTYSSWNPPPQYRKTKGDLFYLVFVTNDGKEFHITSSVYGFFLNHSTSHVFDPTPNMNYFCHSLYDLLVLFDPKFQDLVLNLRKYYDEKHSYEIAAGSFFFFFFFFLSSSSIIN